MVKESFGDIDKGLKQILDALNSIKSELEISNGYLKTLAEK